LGGRSVVLVTVHGIGFEQPAVIGGAPGYADALHAHLREELPQELGDDPNRPERGPVYVCSEFNGSSRLGLGRLDAGNPLAPVGSIAHVALVYVRSQPVKPRIGPVLQTLVRGALSVRRYATWSRLIKLLLADTRALLHKRGAAATPGSGPLADGTGALSVSSLRPRVDDTSPYGPRRGEVPFTKQPSLSEVVRALALDVATYVELNEVRERVRGFIQSALIAVLDRDDVDAVVINAHSQGTVACWDVLCRLPFREWQREPNPRPQKLCQLITAGSPIRKYVDLVAWGQLVGELSALLGEQGSRLGWTNFWDRRDPVADPLDPAQAWQPGQDPESGREKDDGLLLARDPEGPDRRHVKVTDELVDNVAHSLGGGLRAHNYWDNLSEFVTPVATLLRDVHGSGADRTHVT
jgi:hypothetical protein